MLGSLKTTDASNCQDEVEKESSASDLQIINPQYSFPASPPAVHMRQLLVSCAKLASQSDFASADRSLSYLMANSSPSGDSTERLVHQFSRALSLRLDRHYHQLMTTIPNPNHSTSVSHTESSFIAKPDISSSSSSSIEGWEYCLQSCYLSLNQITPFIRFSHLTANQAILEAIQVDRQAIHIIDLDIMHGLQWPPLMQALSDRLRPPALLRITGAGHDLTILHRTGERLLRFAQSLGLRFQFQPLLLELDLQDFPSSSLCLFPDEALAVNCVLYLHKLLRDKDNYDILSLFLDKIKALNPEVVTIAEREAKHNQQVFVERFVEALDHYSAIFESLEATLPPNSRDRLAVEQIWLGREIVDIVAGEDESRRERHERLEWWEMMLKNSGFLNVALSPFALSQAKLLLRLHYPSEGYQLESLNNSFFLGWQKRPLFSVSSWR